MPKTALTPTLPEWTKSVIELHHRRRTGTGTEAACCSHAAELTHLTPVVCGVMSNRVELHFSEKRPFKATFYAPTLNLSLHILYVTQHVTVVVTLS